MAGCSPELIKDVYLLLQAKIMGKLYNGMKMQLNTNKSSILIHSSVRQKIVILSKYIMYNITMQIVYNSLLMQSRKLI